MELNELASRYSLSRDLIGLGSASTVNPARVGCPTLWVHSNFART